MASTVMEILSEIEKVKKHGFYIFQE